MWRLGWWTRLFFLNNDIPQSEGNYRETLEVCYAVCDIILSDKHVEGAQWKGGLWRVYLTNVEARLQVLSTGVSLREAVTLRDKNLYVMKLGNKPVETTRVFVRIIPLSYDNNEIEKALKELDVETLS